MTGIEDIPSAHAPPVERDADERDDEREDDTDRAIKLARTHVIAAVDMLISIMRTDLASYDERIKAATVLLEVSGCL